MKELGRQLRRLLTPRALAAWCGTDRLSALAGTGDVDRASNLPELMQRAADRAMTPASAPLALFVAGREVPTRLLAAALDLETLAQHGLVELAGDTVRATLALLPLGRSLLACDRLDAPAEPELVCWPDDSSYHLAKSLPRDVATGDWIDVGCGSAFAPLFVQHAACIADLNERALARASLGGLLSDVPLEPYTSDVLAGVPPRAWDLVSCNAPIPDDPAAPIWRSTTASFFERLYAQAAGARHIVIHAAESALAPLADLPGERVVVAYTPEPGFAVAWWSPHAPARYVSARRMLTDDRPHLTYEDRAAALC